MVDRFPFSENLAPEDELQYIFFFSAWRPCGVCAMSKVHLYFEVFTLHDNANLRTKCGVHGEVNGFVVFLVVSPLAL